MQKIKKLQSASSIEVTLNSFLVAMISTDQKIVAFLVTQWENVTLS